MVYCNKRGIRRFNKTLQSTTFKRYFWSRNKRIRQKQLVNAIETVVNHRPLPSQYWIRYTRALWEKLLGAGRASYGQNETKCKTRPHQGHLISNNDNIIRIT